MIRPEYDRLLTPAYRVAIDQQTDPDRLEEELHALRLSLRTARSGFERQVLVTKMQYIHDRLADLAAEDQENDV
jgi:methylphosphotriester-DNA--protein-cysteine methyltransferase